MAIKDTLLSVGETTDQIVGNLYGEKKSLLPFIAMFICISLFLSVFSLYIVHKNDKYKQDADPEYVSKFVPVTVAVIIAVCTCLALATTGFVWVVLSIRTGSIKNKCKMWNNGSSEYLDCVQRYRDNYTTRDRMRRW